MQKSGSFSTRLLYGRELSENYGEDFSGSVELLIQIQHIFSANTLSRDRSIFLGKRKDSINKKNKMVI